MKIVILGKNGQLGQSLKNKFYNSKYECTFLSKSELDITDHQKTEALIKNIKPLIIINACAYTNVDKAEEEFKKAYSVNYYAVDNLAKICKENGNFLIHISTDFIFDGLSNSPYKTSDLPNPLNVYGSSKLKGEQSIINSECSYQIIRTSWVFSEYGNNFLKTMLKLSNKVNKISVVDDQFGTPTCAHDLAEAIFQTTNHIEKGEIMEGIFHLSGNEVHSWFSFAKKILDNLDKDIQVNPITTDEYHTKAQRPKYSALESSEFHKNLSKINNKLDDSISMVVSNLINNSFLDDSTENYRQI